MQNPPVDTNQSKIKQSNGFALLSFLASEHRIAQKQWCLFSFSGFGLQHMISDQLHASAITHVRIDFKLVFRFGLSLD